MLWSFKIAGKMSASFIFSDYRQSRIFGCKPFPQRCSDHSRSHQNEASSLSGRNCCLLSFRCFSQSRGRWLHMARLPSVCVTSIIAFCLSSVAAFWQNQDTFCLMSCSLVHSQRTDADAILFCSTPLQIICYWYHFAVFEYFLKSLFFSFVNAIDFFISKL